jgi:hypothetical protein
VAKKISHKKEISLRKRHPYSKNRCIAKGRKKSKEWLVKENKMIGEDRLKTKRSDRKIKEEDKRR